MTYGTGDTIIDSTYSSRPLMFEDALGYRSDAQWVAFYRTPAGDELRYDDGTMSAEGSWFVWHLFVHHPRIAPALQPYQCGSSNEEPPHWLLLNRVARTLSVGMTADVKHFLSQGASPALTSEAQTALLTTIRDRLNQPHQMQHVVEQAIRREEQQVQALKAWLDTL